MEAGPQLNYPYYYEVFNLLFDDRPPGFDRPGMIPTTSIINMAREDGLSSHKRDVLLRVIRRLDRHVMSKAKPDKS